MRPLAFALFLVFVVSWFLHLGSRVPVLGVIRFDLVLLGLIAGLLLLSRRDGAEEPPPEPWVRAVMLALIAFAVVTVPFVEWPGSVVRIGLPQFAKAALFYFFTVHLVTTRRRLAWLLAVFAAAQLFRVAEPLYLHVAQGYWGDKATLDGGLESLQRLSGSPLDWVNPNGLAWIVLTILCFMHYLAPITLWGRVVYLVSVPAVLYALVLTGSRSGMLGLAVVAAMVWVKSPRKLLLTGILAALIVAAAPRLSADLADRYRSIVSSDTKNSTTAEGRLEAVKADIKVALRRPFFGHGLGTSAEANKHFGPGAQITHNLYVEAAQELGFIGLFVFLGLMAAILSSLRRTRLQLGQAHDPPPLLVRLTDALQVWVAMNIVFDLASYGLSGYEWYFAAGLTDAVARLTVATARAAAPAPAPDPLDADDPTAPDPADTLIWPLPAPPVLADRLT
jgi:putative inorganic carbon (hco3(-)) transporter